MGHYVPPCGSISWVVVSLASCHHPSPRGGSRFEYTIQIQILIRLFRCNVPCHSLSELPVQRTCPTYNRTYGFRGITNLGTYPHCYPGSQSNTGTHSDAAPNGHARTHADARTHANTAPNGHARTHANAHPDSNAHGYTHERVGHG